MPHPLLVALFLPIVIFAGSSCGDSNKDDVALESQKGSTKKSALRAFPGAEGFGAYATGGRGGKVIRVTTLKSHGPGSLQEAVSQDGPRIIVFAISGVIEGDIEIESGDVTIAGQTAPGAGITIRGRVSGAYEYGVDNMIIRHIRVRPVYDGSPGHRFDAMQFSRNSLLILDHVSAAFSVDETIDIYESKDVTIQWSTIESSATHGHPKGMHNYGLINGPDGQRVSVHHNLFAHHQSRTPAIANGPAEVRNNVIYNVRQGFVHHNPATGAFNIVGNYFKRGASGEIHPFYFDDEDEFIDPNLKYFLADNIVDDPSGELHGPIDNPWAESNLDLLAPEDRRMTSEFKFSGDYWAPVTTEPAAAAFDSVLSQAGAFPRDIVTRNSVRDTKERGGAWGAYDVGAPLEGLTACAAPSDSDRDGIADDWERQHGLDPSDPSDNHTAMPSGYPAIEEYINRLADEAIGR